MAENLPYAEEQLILSDGCDCAQDGCVKTGYHYADISVPIELKPNTTLGEVVVECCGEPAVDCCEDKNADCCEVTVTQKVSIKIPLYYQVVACMGESTINCDCDTPCCQ
ncbi:MAG: hypothetical protein ACI4SB_01450 [Acutalibacteraceae bacterium]